MNQSTQAIIVAMLSGVVAIVGYQYAFEGEQASTNAAILDTQYEQNQILRTENSDLRTANAVLTKDRVKLQIKLLEKYESSEELRIYLDNMRHAAAWIKTVPDDPNPVPVMWHINRAYEKKFGISSAAYEGKTDFEFWKEFEVAKRFYDNDMRVLNRLDDVCAFEKFPLDPYRKISSSNPLVESLVCKWMTRVKGDRAIAGMIIDITDPSKHSPTEKH